jgi:hypothetical protein
MTLLNGGNVGIGTTDPGTYKLNVFGTVCLDLNADGVCTDNTSAISDARLKTNVTSISNGLELTRLLHPVRFQWNGQNNTGTANSIGFLAQEVQTVFPNTDMVITDTNGYENLDYGKLTAVLTGAVQELDAKTNLFISSANNQWDALGTSFYITNSAGNPVFSGTRDMGTPRSRDMTLSADSIILDGNVNIAGGTLLVGGINLLEKTAENSQNIVGLTQNQNLITQQLTGQLADQNLTLSDKLRIIGKNLDDLNKEQFDKQIATINQQITGNTGDISLLDIRLVTLETVLGIVDNNVNILGDLTVNDITANNLNLSGKLEVDGIVAGVMTVKVVDPEKKTIGQTTICQSGKTYDNETKACVACPDGETCDGKSIVVNTKAVSANSKIFVTPIESTKNQTLYIGAVSNGASFEVKIDNPAENNIEFNWWIVESE